MYYHENVFTVLKCCFSNLGCEVDVSAMATVVYSPGYGAYDPAWYVTIQLSNSLTLPYVIFELVIHVQAYLSQLNKVNTYFGVEFVGFVVNAKWCNKNYIEESPESLLSF